MFNCKAGSSTSRGEVQLAVNRLKMFAGCPGADDELFSDLGICQAGRHQAQYLNLAGGQSKGGVSAGVVGGGTAIAGMDAARALTCSSVSARPSAQAVVNASSPSVVRITFR